MPEKVGSVVGVVCLGTDMQLHIRQHPSCNGKNSRVGNNQRIRTDFLQLLKISLYSRKVLIVGQNIGCNINFYPMLMGKGDSLPNLLIRKISGFGPEAECLSSQIYCISSVNYSRFQYIQTASRNQKFCFSHGSLLGIFTLKATPSPMGTMLVFSSSIWVSVYK